MADFVSATCLWMTVLSIRLMSDFFVVLKVYAGAAIHRSQRDSA